MRPYNKEGELIPEDVWAGYLRQGKLLYELGYREASREPNLFYLNYSFVCVFVDLRSAYDESGGPRAWLYFKWGEKAPWKGTRPRKNAILIEGMRLHSAGVRFQGQSIEDEANLPLLMSIYEAENPDIDS